MLHDHSVILLKPDGASCASVRRLVDRHLERAKLRVLRSRRCRFSQREVLEIWPTFERVDRLVSREFQVRYMTGGESCALHVQGRDALDECMRLKAEARGRFQKCPFENVLHAPSDVAERDHDIRILFQPSSRGRGSRFQENAERDKIGLHGRMLQDEYEAAIRRVAAKLWRLKSLYGWQSLFLSSRRLGRGCHSVAVYTGDPNPIDYNISVLYDLLPNSDLEIAIRLYLEAEISGSSVVASGDFAEMDALRLSITRRGLIATMNEARGVSR